MDEVKPKRVNESAWVWEDDKPNWWPGIYEGLTEAEALAQVGTNSETVFYWIGPTKKL